MPADPTARMAGTVSLSADGKTAVAGGDTEPGTAPNTVAVFVQGATGWVRQAELRSSASSSAISADGNTVIVGSIFGVNGRAGEALVYVRSGETWVQQGPAFSPYSGEGSGASWFGASVALSSDGNVAVIGAPTEMGAGWIYERHDGVWTKAAYLGPTAYRAGIESRGAAVAISGDGSVVLLSTYAGPETWRRTPDGWQQGPTIPVVGAPAMSADGRIAVVGTASFTWSGSDWIPGPALSPSGSGVVTSFTALSGDATVGLVKDLTIADGHLVNTTLSVFARRGVGWTRVAPLSPPAGASDAFPGDGALSADGTTAIVGSNQKAFVFAPGGIVTGVAPAVGSRGGGEKVRITGSGFVGVRGVSFGTVPAASFTVRSPTLIEAITPAALAGGLHVTVTTAQTTSVATLADRFRFLTPGFAVGKGGVRVSFKRPRVRITCARTTCAGTATLTRTGSPALAKGTFSIGAGRTATVRLKLTRTGRRAAKRGTLRRARLSIAVRGAATVRRTVTLR